MSSEMQMIDMERFPRKAHFDYFRSLPYPYVGVTVPVDVTDLLAFCKTSGHSFTLCFLHAAALAADSVPEFRQRIRNGGIVEYSQCGTSHTEARPDGTYGYCTLEHHMPFPEYIPYAEKAQALCREQTGLEEDEDVERLYFISSLPWLNYTSLVQPVAGGDESNPRITWGKAEADGQGRMQMPVSVLCHHALVDGIHLAAFYENLTYQLLQLLQEAD